VLCEGGPTLLRALLAARCVDDLSLTLSPLVVGGEEPAAVHGDPIRPPAAFALAGVHRADGHLLMHYVLAS
jgi:5-amino-6-(5-phosphoribosylamino)uracil reductase